MNTQRALWTFLFFTLVGPFVAGLLAALYTPLAIWANAAPFTAGDHAPFDPSNLPDSAGLMQVMVQAAVERLSGRRLQLRSRQSLLLAFC